MILELALICCSSEEEETAITAAQHSYPKASLVYTSPEANQTELAAKIYPRVPAILCSQLRQFDYGIFAVKKPDGLQTDEELQAWAAKSITQPCPQGESAYQFGVRCTHIFRKIVDEMCAKGIGEAAMLADGTVISSILRRYSIPRSFYRNWWTSPGAGYLVQYDSALFTGKILRAI